MKIVDWLEKKFVETEGNLYEEDFDKAKEIETKEKLKHQLFVGKVSEIIGFEKTVELLKQVNEVIK